MLRKKYGMREPRYGEIDIRNNSAAYAIYSSRNKELPLLIKEVEVVDEIDYNEQSPIDNFAEYVWKLLDQLKPLHKNVIYMRFKLELTLKEAGERLFITSERVRQIEIDALREMRKLAFSIDLRFDHHRSTITEAAVDYYNLFKSDYGYCPNDQQMKQGHYLKKYLISS